MIIKKNAVGEQLHLESEDNVNPLQISYRQRTFQRCGTNHNFCYNNVQVENHCLT